VGLYAGVTRVWGQGLQRRLGKGRVWEVLATWHQRGKRQKLGGLCGRPIFLEYSLDGDGILVGRDLSRHYCAWKMPRTVLVWRSEKV